MNLKAIAQILFLNASAAILVSMCLLLAKELTGRKATATLIPVNTPENAVFLSEKKVLIGRSQECDIMIIDPSVSTNHCIIFQKKGRFFVKDLNSRNGTFINERPVGMAEVKDGDILRIGEKKFIFKAE